MEESKERWFMEIVLKIIVDGSWGDRECDKEKKSEEKDGRGRESG